MFGDLSIRYAALLRKRSGKQPLTVRAGPSKTKCRTWWARNLEYTVIPGLTIHPKKQDTLREVLQSLSSQLNVPPQKMRIWPMNHRTNQTLRPSLIDTEGDLDKAIIEGMEIILIEDQRRNL